MKSKKPRNDRNDVSDIVTVDPSWFVAQLRASDDGAGSGAFRFKRTYLLDNIMTKYADGSTDENVLISAARNAFLEGEASCQRINNGLKLSPEHKVILETARNTMRRLLGAFSYEKVLRHLRHGNGATSIRTRAFGHASYKYAADCKQSVAFWKKKGIVVKDNPSHLAVTPLALKFIDALGIHFPGIAASLNNSRPLLTRGNMLDFVPKNNKTHRTIAKEPCWNMYLQLGVGGYMADRLTLFKNSKFDQSRNQELARVGSIHGHLATLDLARASDSLSYGLVALLLPPDWLKYMDDIRSHYYYQDGSWHEYQKFSTMGNGFTFELQTMIFFAICLACAGIELGDHVGRVSVYGDDIIVPTEASRLVIEVLRSVGFETNITKSFVAGPFRESCGKHYYNGIDVTPFYIRKPINSLSRLVWLLNRLRAWAYCEISGVCDSTYYSLWLEIYKSYPILKKIRGGNDTDRIDQLASRGRPHKVIRAKPKRIVRNERALLWMALGQGFEYKGETIDKSLLNDDVERLYHYDIHPDASFEEVLMNSEKLEHVPLSKLFCEELT